MLIGEELWYNAAMKAKFLVSAVRSVLCVLSVVCVSSVAFAETISHTVDWVSLNGGSAKGLWFYPASTNTVYEDGVETFDGSQYTFSSSIVDSKPYVHFDAANNSGWRTFGFQFTNDCALTIAEAQSVTVPYKYESSGTSNVGKYFRLVIGAGTGNNVKYFSVVSAETCVRGEWTNLTFDMSAAYSTYPDNYAAVRDSAISLVQLLPYSGADNDPGSEVSPGNRGGCKMSKGDSLTVGSFTFSYEEVSGYTVSFDSNGGTAVDSIETDSSGSFVFPAAPIRTDYVFAGWYYNGVKYEPGADCTAVMDTTFAAGWKAADPSVGISATSRDYRKVLDLYAAMGSCADCLAGVAVYYDPLTDICRVVRSGVYEIDAEPVASGDYYDILLSGKGGQSGNNDPRFSLPDLGLTVGDVSEMKFSYRTASAGMVGHTMTVYYKVAGGWHHVTSTNTVQLTEGDEYGVLKFMLAKELGEATYESLKEERISEWKLYPYTVSTYGTDGGRADGGTMPYKKGVSLQLGRVQLLSYPLPGLAILVR